MTIIFTFNRSSLPFNKLLQAFQGIISSLCGFCHVLHCCHSPRASSFMRNHNVSSTSSEPVTHILSEQASWDDVPPHNSGATKGILRLKIRNGKVCMIAVGLSLVVVPVTDLVHRKCEVNLLSPTTSHSVQIRV